VNRPTAGAVGTPVPLRLTVCGLPRALSVMFKVAVSLPARLGVKVMLTEHMPPEASVAPEQVSTLVAKSLASAPVNVTLEMVRLPAPANISVRDCAALVVPTV